jgi:hypothetical protein
MVVFRLEAFHTKVRERARRSNVSVSYRSNDMALQCIIICMRTTLIINDSLLERAREVTGIKQKTALVRAGLEALIAREAGKRLAALGGTHPKISDVPRRRSSR